MSSVKILLINGSPRKYGSSMLLLNVAEKGVLDAGGVVEKINIYDYSIKPCIGCVSDEQRVCRYPCIIEDDDYNMLAKKMLDSDGFIISTPVYWYSVSGVLKNFIDRLTSLENMIIHSGRSLLEGKVAGFIATGNDSGVIYTIGYLMTVFNSMGVHIPPWALAYSVEKDVLEDEQAVMDSYNVGYIVARSAYLLRDQGRWYNPEIDLEGLRETAYKSIEQYFIQKMERDALFKKYLERR